VYRSILNRFLLMDVHYNLLGNVLLLYVYRIRNLKLVMSNQLTGLLTEDYLMQYCNVENF